MEAHQGFKEPFWLLNRQGAGFMKGCSIMGHTKADVFSLNRKIALFFMIVTFIPAAPCLANSLGGPVVPVISVILIAQSFIPLFVSKTRYAKFEGLSVPAKKNVKFTIAELMIYLTVIFCCTPPGILSGTDLINPPDSKEITRIVAYITLFGWATCIFINHKLFTFTRSRFQVKPLLAVLSLFLPLTTLFFVTAPRPKMAALEFVNFLCVLFMIVTAIRSRTASTR